MQPTEAALPGGEQKNWGRDISPLRFICPKRQWIWSSLSAGIVGRGIRQPSWSKCPLGFCMKRPGGMEASPGGITGNRMRLHRWVGRVATEIPGRKTLLRLKGRNVLAKKNRWIRLRTGETLWGGQEWDETPAATYLRSPPLAIVGSGSWGSQLEQFDGRPHQVCLTNGKT